MGIANVNNHYFYSIKSVKNVQIKRSMIELIRYVSQIFSLKDVQNKMKNPTKSTLNVFVKMGTKDLKILAQ